MKIVFNGQEYDGFEQMPPQVQAEYLSAITETRDVTSERLVRPSDASTVRIHESYIYNGREYKNRNDLPPEILKALEDLPENEAAEPDTLIAKKTTVFPPQVIVSTSSFRESQPPPPRLVTACVRLVLYLVFGFSAPEWEIQWGDTIAEMIARFLWGLVAGAGLCVLLIPLLYWPGRHGERSIHELLGAQGWLSWIFPGVLIATATIWALRTRITVRHRAAGKGKKL